MVECRQKRDVVLLKVPLIAVPEHRDSPQLLIGGEASHCETGKSKSEVEIVVVRQPFPFFIRSKIVLKDDRLPTIEQTGAPLRSIVIQIPLIGDVFLQQRLISPRCRQKLKAAVRISRVVAARIGIPGVEHQAGYIDRRGQPLKCIGPQVW
ncbi:hypothetical protein ATY79_28505 [Rhizobium sp. R693]|nr:hypothetical protein ATY79_28505 [Rhizobium sp. R693]